MFNNAIDKRIEVLEKLKEIEKEVNDGLYYLKKAKKILLCGNGGSAADCLHLAAELMVRYRYDREPIAAIALLDSVNLTACGNDYNFNDIFSRQVSALGEVGDLLIAITTSGKSKNIIDAIDIAIMKGMNVIVLTGELSVSNEEISYFDSYIDSTDILKIVVPSKETAIVQECHQLVYHYWCECIDRDLAV